MVKILKGVKGTLVVAAFAGLAMVSYGCGKDKAEAPKAEAPKAEVAQEQQPPAGHPQIAQSGQAQPAVPQDHSGMKAQKEVKLPKEVTDKWKEVKVEIADNAAKSKETLTLKVGSTTALKNGHKVKVEAFVPDYAIAENHIGTRSNEANNPAVLLSITDGANTVARGWVFLELPDFNSFKTDKYAVVLLGPSAKKKK